MGAVPVPVAGPTTAEVKAIAAIDDSVIRNLRITECYHRLSLAMRSRIGGGANWCTFATWASQQAGCTIRGEDFLDRISRHARGRFEILHPIRSLWRVLLRQGIFNPKTRLGRFVKAVHTPFDAFERASDAVAVGNLRVFEEIGFEMARYLGSAAFAGFLAGLRPGPPPDGQDYLRSAFTRYEQLRTETSPARRAQLQLLANLEIGLHEQTRLQAQIQKALEVLPDTADDLRSRYFVNFVSSRYRRFARELTRRVISECMMVLAMPGVVLSLGRHIDQPFPDVLRSVTEPELQRILGDFEPPEGVCDNCGADDWADLHQRMHYIAHLFRVFHFRENLFGPPVIPAQLGRLGSGVPPGRPV